ncbi:hypothetical protein NEOLI_001176 [Neolecta irregularis DAH-3]|uniref:Uncharacterized protein n=1 Tax=Neolecta irregularis (strain DAH-3) TaxID=1198029 RepID=A0A1U7LMW4_NEOID|nr:hypothetical protein NEOLI_001176 [Neolecta irregularis DAH-3]|eukprot:OLL23995.1 hypothetical protein NEOLI_001176 [Neolecta irregularis DAH-3]
MDDISVLPHLVRKGTLGSSAPSSSSLPQYIPSADPSLPVPPPVYQPVSPVSHVFTETCTISSTITSSTLHITPETCTIAALILTFTSLGIGLGLALGGAYWSICLAALPVAWTANFLMKKGLAARQKRMETNRKRGVEIIA